MSAEGSELEPVPARTAIAGRADCRCPAWNIANALTVSRLLLVPVFLVALFADGGIDTGWRIGGLRRLRRRLHHRPHRRRPGPQRNLVTDFGKIADPIADKALTGAALIGLSVARRPAVVGHDRDRGPRGRRHRCCGSG